MPTTSPAASRPRWSRAFPAPAICRIWSGRTRLSRRSQTFSAERAWSGCSVSEIRECSWVSFFTASFAKGYELVLVRSRQRLAVRGRDQILRHQEKRRQNERVSGGDGNDTGGESAVIVVDVGAEHVTGAN